MKHVTAILAIGILTGTTHVAAADLGRLFFDPAQRAEIEKRRGLIVKPEPPKADEVAPAAEPTPEPESLGTATANGRVVRSSGRTTTWVNGEAQHDAPANADRTRVRVPAVAKSPAQSIKVGQTLDRDTGAVTDGLKGGRVQVDRR